ncbi:MAG: hypothetical protein AMXMBFR64_32510 [Myxococcales bacterium]
MRSRTLIVTLALGLVACPEDPKECATGADCPSGACTASGVCVGLDASEGPDWAGGEPDDGGGVDATGGEDVAVGSDVPGALDSGALPGTDVSIDTAAPKDTGPAPDTGGGVCQPNDDGVVTRDEMPIAAGLHASYRVATDVTWSTAAKGTAGSLTWDLSGGFPGDTNTLVEARSLEGTWFEGDFPDATYAARLSETQNLLGVFKVTDSGLFLVGVVSIEDGVTATKVTYDPPAQVLQFPMSEGDVWKTKSTVTGTTLGVWSFYTEDYRSEVDAHGTLKTPFGDFPVLRVNVELVRTVGVLPTTTRTHMFVAECFGTVGTVVSKPNELKAEFEAVSELRRLAP